MTRRPRRSALLVAVLLAVVPGTAPGAYAETHWKARLLSGDNTAPVFDNATREMPRLLERRGVEVVATFTADPAKVSETVHLSTHEERKLLSESGRLRQGTGGHVRGTRRRSALMLPTLVDCSCSPPVCRNSSSIRA
jgi:hypothetical protein